MVAAFLGCKFLLSSNVGGPIVPPEPSATPTPAPLPPTGALDPGTYLLDDTRVTARPFTVTVADGWSTDEGFVFKGDAEGTTLNDVYVATWLLTHVYVDACDEAAGRTEVGTAEAIVDALSVQAGSGMTGPVADTLGGVATQRFDVEFDPAICSNDATHLWPDPGPQTGGGLQLWPGQAMTVHVIDFKGGPMVMVAESAADASAADVAELEAVVDSFQFIDSEG